MSDKKIKELIGSLSEELKPTKCMAHPFKRLMPWLIMSVIYLVLLINFMGIRHDLSEAFTDPRFIFEITLMAFIGISAAVCAVYLCIPDMRGRSWMIALPFTGLTLFSIWSAIHAIMVEGAHMPHLHIDHCMGEGAFMTVIPLAMLVFLTRKGSTTRPILMAVMNVLSIAAVAYIGLRFTCAMDTVAHATIQHLAPYVVIGLIFAVAARKIFKW